MNTQNWPKGIELVALILSEFVYPKNRFVRLNCKCAA